MKVKLFLLGILLVNVCLKANSQVFEWVKPFGNTGFDMSEYCGNYITNKQYLASGKYQGNVSFDTNAFTGANGGFILKFNNSGAITKAIKVSTTSGPNTFVSSDKQGNIYLGANYDGILSVGGQSISSNGSADGFAFKLDSNGVTQWAKTFGGIDLDRAARIYIDKNDNPILVGYYASSNFAVGTTIGNITLQSPSNRNSYFFRLRKADGIATTVKIGSGGFGLAWGYTYDNIGSEYICGGFSGNHNFDGTNLISNGNNDAYLVKYNSNGVLQWARNYGNTGSDYGYAVHADSIGNVYLFGFFSGTISYNGQSVTSAGGTDGFVAKINGLNGNIIWIRRIGGTGNDEVKNGFVNFNGNVHFIAEFRNTITVNGNDFTSLGNTDICSGIYNENGLLEEFITGGGNGQDIVWGITADSSDKQIISGAFTGTASFGTINLNSVSGSTDAFVARISFICDTTKITTQPQPTTVCQGSAINLSVGATGANLSYQWKRGTTNVGTNSPTLSIANASAANAGQYTVTVTGSCGTVVSNTVLVNVTPTTTIITQPVPDTVCPGTPVSFSVVATGANLSYQWKRGTTNVGTNSPTFLLPNVTQADTGSYSVTVSGNCGTVVSNLVKLNIDPSFYQVTTYGICEGDSLLIFGKYRKTPSLYLDTLKAATKCDSIIGVQLFYLPKSNSITSVTICASDSFLFGGKYYQQSGIYVNKYTNAFGCDSILQLNLSIRRPDTTGYDSTICNGKNIIFGGRQLSQEGRYLDTLSTLDGCDSIVYLNLKLNPIYLTTLEKQICENDSVLLGNQYLKQTGNYTLTELTTKGCDSITQLNLIVVPLPRLVDSLKICNNWSVYFNNTTYTDTGIYTYPIQGQNGCMGTYIVKVTPHSNKFCYDSLIRSPLYKFPNIITPNNDGLNDAFIIPFIDFTNYFKLSIINRWGHSVFKTDNYQNNFTGNALPTGVYFINAQYRIEGFDIEIRNWLSIIK